jgi:hypothetical protein
MDRVGQNGFSSSATRSSTTQDLPPPSYDEATRPPPPYDTAVTRDQRRVATQNIAGASNYVNPENADKSKEAIGIKSEYDSDLEFITSLNQQKTPDLEFITSLNQQKAPDLEFITSLNQQTAPKESFHGRDVVLCESCDSRTT